jgi:hypothetical protein
LLYPNRDCHRADASALTDEVDDHPSTFPQLDVFDVESDKFAPAQSAADQESDDHIVALPLKSRTIRNR